MYSDYNIAQVAAQIRTYLGKRDPAFADAPYLPHDKLGDAVRYLGGTLKKVPESQWDYAWGTGLIRTRGNGPENPHPKSQDNFTIEIPDYTSPLRDVFTVAHEIGHLFLHLNYNTKRWQEGEFRDTTMHRALRNASENEANKFAGCMLMPIREYKEVAQEKNYNISSIAEHFGVSNLAAETRGKFIGVFPW